jgi:hypothetical protein
MVSYYDEPCGSAAGASVRVPIVAFDGEESWGTQWSVAERAHAAR